jgi:hypothetical protein
MLEPFEMPSTFAEVGNATSAEENLLFFASPGYTVSFRRLPGMIGFGSLSTE